MHSQTTDHRGKHYLQSLWTSHPRPLEASVCSTSMLLCHEVLAVQRLCSYAISATRFSKPFIAQNCWCSTTRSISSTTSQHNGGEGWEGTHGVTVDMHCLK